MLLDMKSKYNLKGNPEIRTASSRDLYSKTLFDMLVLILAVGRVVDGNRLLIYRK